MTWLRPAVSAQAAVLLALALGAAASPGAGQPPSTAPSASPSPTRPHKSVYGKLASVDRSANGVAMTTDAGERVAWQFSPGVIAEAAQFKAGDPMIVIYRQTAANEKRVTALAFPGSAATPIYVNTTGARVVVRSSSAVDGECGQAGAGPVSEATIPAGGRAEVLEACWCCASPGETCTPGNKSGPGRALLVQCFK